jgi:spermidine/putrescine transport system ATP-binding protein
VVKLLARPEDVAVGPADAFGLGFTGTVARVYFVGTDYRLVVEVPGAGSLLATVRPAPGGAPPPAQDATVALNIPRAALHVVPGEDR